MEEGLLRNVTVYVYVFGQRSDLEDFMSLLSLNPTGGESQ